MRIIDRRLIEACKNGDTLTAEKLLFRGADPNARANEWPYRAALLIATLYGHLKIITTLIRHGADPYVRNTLGKSALHYAIEYKNYDIAKYLLIQLQLDPNTQDQWGRPPLPPRHPKQRLRHAQTPHPTRRKPHATDKDGQTALHHAAAKGRYETVQYLIIHLDLDPNAEDHDGTTPFMIAASKGDIPMLRLLIQLGANPYATDHQGQNALHHATFYDGDDETVQYLIIYLNLDPNQQDHEGITPLLIAIERRYTFFIPTLIRLGAHPHIPSHHGQTPTAIARQHRIPLPKPQPSTITL